MLAAAGFCTNPVVHESKPSRYPDSANRERLIHESSRCTTELSRKGLKNSVCCVSTLQLILEVTPKEELPCSKGGFFF